MYDIIQSRQRARLTHFFIFLFFFGGWDYPRVGLYLKGGLYMGFLAWRAKGGLYMGGLSVRGNYTYMRVYGRLLQGA